MCFDEHEIVFDVHISFFRSWGPLRVEGSSLGGSRPVKGRPGHGGFQARLDAGIHWLPNELLGHGSPVTTSVVGDCSVHVLPCVALWSSSGECCVHVLPRITPRRTGECGIHVLPHVSPWSIRECGVHVLPYITARDRCNGSLDLNWWRRWLELRERRRLGLSR